MAHRLLDLDYEELRRAAVKFCQRKNWPQEAEDFAQYVCLVRFKGKRKTLRMQSLWIDYMRLNYGKNLTPSGKVKFNIMRPMLPEILENIPAKKIDDDLVFNDCLKDLSEKEKQFVILYIKYGYSCLELGKALGATESYAWQLLHKIFGKIRHTIK